MAAVELVSPSNKDRDTHRRAFAVKCASYLSQGVSLVVVDIVTSRQANLHKEMLEVLRQETATLPEAAEMYAVAYRPVVRNGSEQIEAWPEVLPWDNRCRRCRWR